MGRNSQVDAGRETLELADPLLEVGKLDPFGHPAVARLARLGAGQLQPLEVEPALPALQSGKEQDAERGQAEARHRHHRHRFAHHFLPFSLVPASLPRSAANRSRSERRSHSWGISERRSGFWSIHRPPGPSNTPTLKAKSAFIARSLPFSVSAQAQRRLSISRARPLF